MAPSESKESKMIFPFLAATAMSLSRATYVTDRGSRFLSMRGYKCIVEYDETIYNITCIRGERVRR